MPPLLVKIDRSRPFAPEVLCPFTYLPEAADLPVEVTLRQQQLYGLCILEMIQFFESLAHRLLPSLMRELAGTKLGAGLTEFLAEEERHSALFAALNRTAAPELYAERRDFFVRLPGWINGLIAACCARPRLFPLWLWMIILQEERSLHISRAYLANAERLEPQFVAIQRMHAADEARHVRWDEQLIEEFWPRTPRWWRNLNARAFSWMIGEYFHAPKRAGARLIERLAVEFPDQSGPLRALHPALAALDQDPAWQALMHSRAIMPRTFALMDQWPEFHHFHRHITAYVPA